MIDAVLLFGFMNVVMEFVILGMLSPRFRLRILGRSTWGRGMHVLMFMLNLSIHWGTLVGTMSAVMAFISSIVTVAIARIVWGGVNGRMQYRVGLVRYSHQELA